MSMIVTTICPEGIVMAADSAASTYKLIDLENLFKGNTDLAIENTFNGTCARIKENTVGHKLLTRSCNKLRVVKGDKIAISEGNQSNIGKNSLAPYLEHFCNSQDFDSPKSCADALLNFIKNLDPNVKAIYSVCGYNHEGIIPSPEFWFVDVANDSVTDAFCGMYSINFCGDNEYFSQYTVPISKQLNTYCLQDAIDASLFAIDMSIKLARFIDREEFISAPIDLLVIKPSGVQWVQRKALRAEG